MNNFVHGLLTGWVSALIGIIFYLRASAPIRKAKNRAYYGDYK